MRGIGKEVSDFLIAVSSLTSWVDNRYSV